MMNDECFQEDHSVSGVSTLEASAPAPRVTAWAAGNNSVSGLSMSHINILPFISDLTPTDL